MKILSVKLANAVRAGRTEKTFVESTSFDITEEGYYLAIVEKSSGIEILTTIFNVISVKREREGVKEGVSRGSRRLADLPKGT